MIERLLLVTLLLVSSLACSPRRPAGVPADATWVGSRKQGAFVQMGGQTLDGWRFKIYDRQGLLVADAPFVLRGVGRSELDPQDLTGWDGRNLYLKDGAVLAPKP